MVPLLVFFGAAVVFGSLLRVVLGLRFRAVSRQPDVSDGDLCQLRQARRITAISVIASMVGLTLVGLALVVPPAG